MSAFDPVAEQRLHRLAEHVHELGPAPMLHAMREIASGTNLRTVLERYADLPAEFICIAGGARFLAPLCLVGEDRP